MTIEDLNAIAWRDFIGWAFDHPRMLEAFEQDTGRHIRLATPPIEVIIDEACGVENGNWKAFIRWVTEKHWGLKYAPKEYQKHIAEGVSNVS